jgi:hypothetical protein
MRGLLPAPSPRVRAEPRLYTAPANTLCIRQPVTVTEMADPIRFSRYVAGLNCRMAASARNPGGRRGKERPTGATGGGGRSPLSRTEYARRS